MAITFVQKTALATGLTVATQQTAAFTTNPTIGNYIFVWVWGWSDNNQNASPTVTDTLGNTYTIPTNAKQSINNDLFGYLAYCKITSTGSNFRVTGSDIHSFAPASLQLCAAEFTGIVSSNPLDGSVVGRTGTTGVPSPGSLTFSSGDLIIALMVRNTATFLGSTPSGFTRVQYQNDGSTYEVGEAVYSINPTSPTNPSWITSSSQWVCAHFGVNASEISTVINSASLLMMNM